MIARSVSLHISYPFITPFAQHRLMTVQGAESRAGQGNLSTINPSLTMLSLEDLDEMTNLSGSILYSAEVKRLPHLSREEQRPLIDKARHGDKDAKDTLILHCLKWSITRAVRIYLEQEPEHLDVMDLVGVANVEIMEKMDRAIAQMEDPVMFLLSSAAYEMQSYCRYKNPLIQRPRQSNERLQKADPHPASTVSLEATDKKRKLPLSETLAAKAYVLEADEEVERREARKYALLHRAVDELSPTLRRVIVEGYGLFGQPARTKQELANSTRRKLSGIRDADLRARKLLAERLAPYGTIFRKR